MYSLPRAKDLFALLENTRSPDSPARLFSQPQAQIIAYRPEEVLPALQTLAQKTRGGLYACGYIAYEAGNVMQDLPLPAFAKKKAPLLHFQLFADSRELSKTELNEWLDSLAGASETAVFNARLSEDENTYSKKIRRIQDLIKAGDTYQVNYTLPFHFNYNGNPAALYRALRQTQRVEFSALLNFPEARVLSLSPELFLSRSGQHILTRPMKGTAGRGETEAEDKAIAEQLRNDPKSRAENLMIVDLLRNDLGRVALTGSVKVPSLFDVEIYETLQQMTSTITGELAAGATVADILPSLFPCGSITGAPKHRTMQIIAELEKSPRGVYTGAIGYVEPNGDFCFNVPIRTVVSSKPGVAVMNVGSGIVSDSRAHAEYAEVLLKTRFLQAVNQDVGLIESMHLSPDGSLRHLELHLARLKGSAQAFGFYFPEQAIRAELAAYTLHHKINTPRRLRLQLAGDGTFSLANFAIPDAPTDVVEVVLSTQRIDSNSVFRRHKTTRRDMYESEYAAAVKHGAYEVLFLNEHGRVAEAARHNVFIKRGSQLITPPLSEGALPGILREFIEITEAPLTLDELKSAEAIFVGNSVRGLTRVKLPS